MAATRFNLYKLLLGCLCLLISTTYAQLLSADFTNCLESAPQAPANQLLNISRVYAQLDTGRGLSGAADDNTNNQALLRLVALGETGIESEGFSNVTNYLGKYSTFMPDRSFTCLDADSDACSHLSLNSLTRDLPPRVPPPPKCWTSLLTFHISPCSSFHMHTWHSTVLCM